MEEICKPLLINPEMPPQGRHDKKWLMRIKVFCQLSITVLKQVFLLPMKYPVILFTVFTILSCKGHKKPEFNEAYLFSIDTLYLKKTYRSLKEANKTNVEEVNKIVLFDKGLNEFPEELYEFPYLNVLEITFNNLSDLPEDIGYFQYMQGLYLQKNTFNEFPTEVYQLKQLKRLGLGRNNITEVPSSIDSLRSIEELYLERNQISALPSSFYNLKNLKILKLSHNQFSSLSPELKTLTKLEKLYLTNNKFASMPGEIKELPNIRYLEIGRNLISKDTLKAFAASHPHIKVVF